MDSGFRFRTAYSGGRPVRLREKTRRFCYESLQGKYGDDAMKTPSLSLDDVEGFESLPDYEKYSTAVRRICEKAPLRVTEEELVCGAATLGDAVFAYVPVKFRDAFIFPSINHLTVDFFTPVICGVDFYTDKINKKLQDRDLTERQRQLLLSMLSVIGSMRMLHGRYMEKLSETRPELLDAFRNVPFKPAGNFREAVQSLWFLFSFTRLTGNWPGIGRIDKLLGPYLEKDLREGAITTDDARELLASFFIKGCEWVRGLDAPKGSGDAQHYQNIILGGTDRDGNDITNEVTYLILDVVEELPIGDFPITIRFNKKSPEKLYRRASEVIRHGGGTVAVYNEETVLAALERFGYDKKEARDFANDGCWEVQVPGCTRFTYNPFDGLQILLNDTLRLDSDELPHFESFGEVLDTYLKDLERRCDEMAKGLLCGCLENAFDSEQPERFRKLFPTTVIDLFENDCIDKALGYLEGGTRYSVIPLHIGGGADVANSLYAIKKLCFDEKIRSLDELLVILKNNWEGEEYLRQYVRNKYVYYGNDNPEVDSIAAAVFDSFSGFCEKYGKNHALWIPSGVSTFGRQLEWKDKRRATPFGSRRGDILSGNASPTPGTDLEGATAVIKSYCAADLTKQVTGSALDIKLLAQTVKGEDGIGAVEGLIKGFMALGGFFMQPDVADAELLKEAQKDPASFKSLSVRVSGWNARFVSLDENWQRMIIERESGGLS